MRSDEKVQPVGSDVYTTLQLQRRPEQHRCRRAAGGGQRAVEPQPAAQRPQQSKSKRLSYMEQREFDAMEATVLAAEERLEEAKRRAEDPAIAADANALQQRYAELSAARSEVDRSYTRWAELEAKLT